jgi:hypothetical protein
MKKLIIPIAVGVISLAISSLSFGDLLAGKSIEGQIQNISANKLTIQEDKADQATEQAAPVSIEVNQDTLFEQVDSLSGLNQGDRVKIEYQEDQDRNLATTVSKIEDETLQPKADMQQPTTEEEGTKPPQ